MRRNLIEAQAIGIYTWLLVCVLAALVSGWFWLLAIPHGFVCLWLGRAAAYIEAVTKLINEEYRR